MSSEGWGWTLWCWGLLTLKSWWDVLKWQREPVFSFDDSSATALQQLLYTFSDVGRGKNRPWVCAGVAGEWDPAPVRPRCSGAQWSVPYVSCPHGIPCSVVQHYDVAGAAGEHRPYLHHCPSQRKSQCHQHFHLQPVILWHPRVCLLPPLHRHIHANGPLGVRVAVVPPGAVHPVYVCDRVCAVAGVHCSGKTSAHHQSIWVETEHSSGLQRTCSHLDSGLLHLLTFLSLSAPHKWALY